MASFLYQSRTTSYLLHNIRKANPIFALLHTNPLLPSPHPLKPSNPRSPLPFNTTKALFSFTRIPGSLNPRILQSHSISRAPDYNPPTLPGNPQLKLRHQEITGPTVDRDISALANETREVLESLRRSVHHLSSAMAVLGIAHLGIGAWIAYASQPPNVVSVHGIAATAFPFSLAFLLRRTLKPFRFLQKMEEQGRLQILTLSLQVSKNLRLLFVRTKVACICCIVGISAGFVVSLWVR